MYAAKENPGRSMTPPVCGRQRIDDPHLIGHRGDVDDLANVAVKAFERAFRRLGIECARRHLMCGEIVKQRSGDSGLSDAAFVRADQDQCWFSHNPTLTDATRVSILKLISTQRTESWKDSSLFAAHDDGVLG
jgi:hypothetical protein